MIAASTAFIAAEAAASAGKKRKLLCHLRNVAHRAEGGLAASSGDFSATFPAAGAIDGQKAHLNFGAATGADNGDGDAIAEDGIGGAGWKSTDASQATAINTAALWSAGIQTKVRTMGVGVELAMPENWIPQSELLTDATAWSAASHITVAAAGTPPAGYGMSFSMIPDSVGGGPDHYIYNPSWIHEANGNFVAELLGKSFGTHFVCIEVGDGGNGIRCWFDLDAGSVLAAGSNASYGVGVTRISAAIVSLGSGWWKCRVVIGGNAATSYLFAIRPSDADNSIGWTGNGVDGILATGAQVVRGTTAKLYAITGANAEAPLYEQGFDAAGEAAALTAFDSWSAVSGAATIQTLQAASWPAAATGRRGVDLFGTGASSSKVVKRTALPIAGSAIGYMAFRLKQVAAGTGVSRFELALWKDGTAARYALLVKAAGEMTRQGAGAEQYAAARPVIAVGWNHVVLRFTGSAVNSVTIDLYLNGRHVDQSTGIDMSGWDSVRLTVAQDSSGGAPEYYFDDLRIGTSLLSSGTEEVTIDLGAVPSSGRATLAMTGDAAATAGLVVGAFYGLGNADADYALGDAAARQRLAQTITPAARSTITGVRVRMKQVNTGVNPAETLPPAWIELQATTAGLPNGTVLATARAIDQKDISTSEADMDFVFPLPFTTDETGTTVYALVFRIAQYANSLYYFSTNYYSVRVDASAPSYSGGQFATFDGTTWTADANRDLCFCAWTERQDEDGYAFANQDGNQNVGRGASNNFASQGFKTTLDAKVRGVRLLLKKPAGVSYTAGSRLFVEIQTDDGAGKPSGTFVGESTRIDPAAVLGASYAVILFPFAAAAALTGGTQYHAVLRTNWTDGSATVDFVHLGVDTSSPSYAGGSLYQSDDATPPAWTLVSGTAAVFSVVTVPGPFVRLELAQSDDGSFTDGSNAYAKVDDDPGRTGSPATSAISAAARRYWRVRATVSRGPTGGADLPPGAALLSLTLTMLFMTEKWLEIDFGQDRTISTVEICGHPTRGGCRSFYLRGKPAGGSFATITAIDTVEARRKGGSATSSVASGIVTGTGDWWRVNFSADQTIRYLRIYVKDNLDAFARILEVEARRTIDLTNRIVAPCKVGQDSDPLSRVLMAREFSVQLRNDDGYLTGTSGAAAWSDQVGRGCILYLSAGYEGTELLPMGIFYVDDWWCSWNDRVDVRATDGYQLMNQSVRTEYRANATVAALVEYLANLCDIPSQWLKLDDCQVTVPLFTAESPNAWSEAQKIRQSIAWSSLTWEADGYLRLYLSGSTAHGTGSESITSIGEAYGPPQMIGAYAYIFFRDTSGNKIGIARYDLALGTWKIMNAGTTPYVQVGGVTKFIFGLIMQQFDGEVWGLVWTGDFLLLYKYDPIGDVLSQVCQLRRDTVRAVLDTTVTGGANCCALALEGGHRWYFVGNSPFSVSSPGTPDQNRVIWEIDLASRLLRSHALAGATRFSAIARESGTWLLATQDVAGAALKVVVWNPYSDAVAGTLSLFAGDAAGIIACAGIATTGLGRAYLSAWERTRTNYGRPRLAKLAVTAAGATLSTTYHLAPNIAATDQAKGGINDQAAAWIDGLLVAAGTISIEADGTDQNRVFYLDEREATPGPKDAGPIIPGASAFRWAVPFTSSGRGRILLFADDLRLVDVSVRAAVARVATPQYTISHAAGGVALPSPRIGFGATRSGASRILNLVEMTSRALAQDSVTKTVWTADGLPWNVPVTDSSLVLKVRCPLSDPIDVAGASTIVVLAKTGPGTIAWSFSRKHPTNPEIKLTISGPVTITSLAIQGKPYYERRGLRLTVVGSDLSFARYGGQRETIDNEYFQDLATMAVVGASAVARFQLPGSPVEGVQSVAILRAEILDLATVVAAKWGLSKDLVVFKFEHDLIDYRTAWKLAEG